MEKPDANGYVNISWPSRNVPHGGIFHTRTVEPSPNQQQLLKVQVEESKLDLKLRHSDVYGLRAPAPLGAAVETKATSVVPTSRPRTSRRRSLSAIRSSGVLDVDMYRPVKRGEDREQMKERLANSMAFGDSAEQAPMHLQQRRKKKLAPKLPTAKETWNDLVTQIRERAEWLAEMELLGEASPHREILQDQIAERMRALDALGVDSACSTARSSLQSTTRLPLHSTVRSPVNSTNCSRLNSANGSTADAECASRSAHPRRDVRSSIAPKGEASKKWHPSRGRHDEKPEENVMAYSQLSPPGYSPGRRV